MFAQAIIDSINKTISNFTTAVESKYNIPKSDLFKMWTESKSSTKSVKTKPETSGLKCKHLWGKTAKHQNTLCGAKVCDESETKSYCKKHLGNEKKKKKDDSELVKSINENRSLLRVSRNEYGNYEDKASHIVFNAEQRAYGKQVKDQVIPLSDEDIEHCKFNKWAYELPRTITDRDNKDFKDYKELSSGDDVSSDSEPE